MHEGTVMLEEKMSLPQPCELLKPRHTKPTNRGQERWEQVYLVCSVLSAPGGTFFPPIQHVECGLMKALCQHVKLALGLLAKDHSHRLFSFANECMQHQCHLQRLISHIFDYVVVVIHAPLTGHKNNTH